MTVDEKKRAVREHVWALLEEHRAAPAGVHGRIPAFFGAEKAADRLAELPEWQSAKIMRVRSPIAFPHLNCFDSAIRSLRRKHDLSRDRHYFMSFEASFGAACLPLRPV